MKRVPRSALTLPVLLTTSLFLRSANEHTPGFSHPNSAADPVVSECKSRPPLCLVLAILVSNATGCSVDAVISGLPLLSGSWRKVVAILDSSLKLTRLGATFYQFTHSPGSPRAIPNRLGLVLRRLAVLFVLTLTVSVLCTVPASGQHLPDAPSSRSRDRVFSEVRDRHDSEAWVPSELCQQILPRTCQSIWLTSTHPWINTQDLRALLLMTEPEFSIREFSFATSAEAADLTVEVARNSERTINIVFMVAPDGGWLQETFDWPEPAPLAERYAKAEHAVTLAIHHFCDGHQPPLFVDSSQARLDEATIATLRLVHALQTHSSTSWMDDEVLLAAMQARPEFVHIGVKLSDSSADAELIVQHDLKNPVFWSYTLQTSPSGDILVSGHVIALEQKRAAGRIAAIVAHLFTPSEETSNAGSASVPGTPVFATSENKHGQALRWTAQLLHDTPTLSADKPIRITLEEDKLIARNPDGAVAFSIAISQLLDVSISPRTYHSAADLISTGESSGGGDDSGGAAIGLLAYISAVAVLDTIRIPDKREITLAWREGKTVHMDTFYVMKGDPKELYEALASQIDVAE